MLTELTLYLIVLALPKLKLDPEASMATRSDPDLVEESKQRGGLARKSYRWVSASATAL